jgi:hypothetical protein
MTISRSILRIRNVSDESHRENQNTRFVLSIPPPTPTLTPRKSCSSLDNVEDYGTAIQVTDDNIIGAEKIDLSAR